MNPIDETDRSSHESVAACLNSGPGTNPNFNFDTNFKAKTIVGYAQAAYCTEGLADWNCGAVCDDLPRLDNVTVVEDGPTQGQVYVGYKPDTNHIVVSFRGASINQG